MSATKQWANEIKNLKPSAGFTVSTKKDREDVLKMAKLMKAAGLIEFDISTRATPGGKFKVVAI